MTINHASVPAADTRHHYRNRVYFNNKTTRHTIMATFESNDNVSDIESNDNVSDIEDDEECVLFNEPYMYEPEYTDEELIEMDAKRSEREKKSVETAAPGDAIENRDRTSGDWWCQCRKCIQMPTEDECFCCREWDLVTNADGRRVFLLQGVGLSYTIVSLSTMH